MTGGSSVFGSHLSIFHTAIHSDLHRAFTRGLYGREEGIEEVAVVEFDGMQPKPSSLLLALAGGLLVAVTVFRVPLATVFALGLVLICPLLMVGMHHDDHAAGHRTEGEGPGERRDRSGEGAPRVRSTPVRTKGLAPDRGADHGGEEVQP